MLNALLFGYACYTCADVRIIHSQNKRDGQNSETDRDRVTRDIERDGIKCENACVCCEFTNSQSNGQHGNSTPSGNHKFIWIIECAHFQTKRRKWRKFNCGCTVNSHRPRLNCSNDWNIIYCLRFVFCMDVRACAVYMDLSAFSSSALALSLFSLFENLLKCERFGWCFILILMVTAHSYCQMMVLHHIFRVSFIRCVKITAHSMAIDSMSPTIDFGWYFFFCFLIYAWNAPAKMFKSEPRNVKVRQTQNERNTTETEHGGKIGESDWREEREEKKPIRKLTTKRIWCADGI